MVKSTNRNNSIDPFASDREAMLDQIRAYGVHNRRVLEAIRQVPRHLFIPEKNRKRINPYGDYPCDIGWGQTISQPFIVAYMTALLGIGDSDRVLEIGTGCGYQTAVLAVLANQVYSVELNAKLSDRAADVIRSLGFTNIHMKVGNGYDGWPEYAPYSGIMVTCAPEKAPKALLDQLVDGGRMVIPAGDIDQHILIFTKHGTEYSESKDIPVRFVPMLR